MSYRNFEEIHSQIYEDVVATIATRSDNVQSLLKTLSTFSVLFISGWITLIVNSNFNDLENKIIWITVIHILVILFVVITHFLIVITNTFTLKNSKEHQVISTKILFRLRAELQAAHTDFDRENFEAIAAESLRDDFQQLRGKYDNKIKKIDLVAWIFGTTSIILFIIGLMINILAALELYPQV